jgi:hypothetical protein
MSRLCIEGWFAKLALDELSKGADDSQEWARIRAQLENVDNDSCYITRLVAEEILDAVVVPEKNCSCRISPPCSDCVDHAGTREQLEIIREWLL